MEIRGERRCKDCDTEWSYYDTASVACPACGSMRSVGVDDRTIHTNRDISLDLSTAKDYATKESLDDGIDAAIEATSDYLRRRGFIDAGTLLSLDDQYLGAYELREIARTLNRSLEITDDEELYLITLLRDLPKGSRPDPTSIPNSLHPEHGLAVATAVDKYSRDFSTWIENQQSTEPHLEGTLRRVHTHQRRLEALDGDLPPIQADRLVVAVRSLAAYARHGDPTDLEQARTALDALA